MNNLQKYVQEKCVMAAHPECGSLEEALQKDFNNGCMYKRYSLSSKRCEIMQDIRRTYFATKKCKILYDDNNNKPYGVINDNGENYYLEKIIGQPCTLSRIMNALDQTGVDLEYYDIGFGNGFFCISKTTDCYDTDINIDFTLKNKDGTDALFEDQTEETQQEIAKILNYNI